MLIAMVAGEASGDLLAAHLIEALRKHIPQAEFVGIGGPRMTAVGFKAWWPFETLAVMGYVDALKRLPELLHIRRGLLHRLKESPPDIFIGIDAPDFNLGIESRLKGMGVRTVHYVSPSIWAWRGRRVHKIGQAADHVMCLFPFEPELYTRHGYAASFVGHPFADVFPLESKREAARETLALSSDEQIVAILPGSREGEVRRLAPVCVETIQVLTQKRPEVRFVVPLITRVTRGIFCEEMEKAQIPDGQVRLLFGHAHEAMAAADAVVVASGTATLEAALLKCPMVIIYKIGQMSFRLAKILTYLPWVGLPNILAHEFIVPELLQSEATAPNIAAALIKWLDDKEARAVVLEHFLQIHQSLRQGNSDRAAGVILKLLGRV